MGFWSSLLGLSQPASATQANIVTNAVAGQVRDKSFNQGNQAIGQGQQQLNAAGGTAADAAKTYKAGAGGSMEELQKMYNPEISTVMSQFDNAAKSASQFGPRGGGRTALMGELPFKKAAAAGGVISGARAGAAKGETEAAQTQGGIGQAMGALGTTQTGQGIQAYAPAEGAVQQGTAQVAQGYGALGQLIGGAATMLLGS